TVAGAGADTLNVDDTGSTTPRSGTVTANTITGLGMGPGGIIYSGIAGLNISLGGLGNTFNVNGTAPGTTTTVNSGAGADTVTVNATGSPLTVNTQAGADVVNVRAVAAPASVNSGSGDTVNVSSNAPTNTGTLSGIAAVLTVSGGTANVSDSG